MLVCYPTCAISTMTHLVTFPTSIKNCVRPRSRSTRKRKCCVVTVAAFSRRHSSNHVGPFFDLTHPLERRAFVLGFTHRADEVLAIVADGRQLFNPCPVDHVDDLLAMPASAGFIHDHRAIGQEIFAYPARSEARDVYCRSPRINAPDRRYCLPMTREADAKARGRPIPSTRLPQPSIDRRYRGRASDTNRAG